MVGLFLDPQQRCCLRVLDDGVHTQFVQMRGAEIAVHTVPSAEFTKSYRITTTSKPLADVIQRMLALSDMHVITTPGARAALMAVLATLQPNPQEDTMFIKKTDKVEVKTPASKAGAAKVPASKVAALESKPVRAPYTPPFPPPATAQKEAPATAKALPFSTAKVVAGPGKTSVIEQMKALAPATAKKASASEPVAKKASASEPVAKKASASEPVAKKGKYDEAASVALICKTNPYREGTMASRTFGLWETCSTVGGFRQACAKQGCDAGYLTSFVAKGYIKVGR